MHIKSRAHTCRVSANRTIRFFRSSTRSGLSQYDCRDRGTCRTRQSRTSVHGPRWVTLHSACVSYRVCPQGSDDFGQRQLPKLLHVRSIDQTLCRVKDVILHNKEAGWRGANSTEKDHERSEDWDLCSANCKTRVQSCQTGTSWNPAVTLNKKYVFMGVCTYHREGFRLGCDGGASVLITWSITLE